MTVRVVRLAHTEVELFEQLLLLFADAFAEENTPSPVQSSKSLASLLADENLVVLAALEGETVVGGATLRLWDSYVGEGREAYLYDMAVAETHRRTGVGSGLLVACRQFALENNVVALWVQADGDDDDAIAFYRSARGGTPLQERSVAHFEFDLTQDLAQESQSS